MTDLSGGTDDDAERMRALASRLRTALAERVSELSALLDLLVPPLSWLGIDLPTASISPAQHHDAPWASLPESQRLPFVRRWLQHTQTGLLERGLIVDWADELERQGQLEILESWFCPRSDSDLAASVALSAYGALLAFVAQPAPHREGLRFAFRMLDSLASLHPLRSIHRAVRASKTLEWDAAVRLLVSVPAKAANAFGALSQREPRHDLQFPPSLGWTDYVDTFSRSYETLLASNTAEPRALAVVVAKLARSGGFPADATLVQQHGFWTAMLHGLQHHVSLPVDPTSPYVRAWRAMMDELDSVELATVVRSALVSFAAAARNADPPPPIETARRVKTAANLLTAVFGPVRHSTASDATSMRVFEAVMSTLLGREGLSDLCARIAAACFGSERCMFVPCTNQAHPLSEHCRLSQASSAGLGLAARARARLGRSPPLCVCRSRR